MWGYYTSFNSDDSNNNNLKKPVPQGPETWGLPGMCLPGFLDAEGDESRWLQDSYGQNSGAYIFRPSRPDEKLTLLPIDEDSITVFKSDLVSEVHASYGDWVKQVTRVVKDKQYVEIEWTVGPVPDDDGIGKEVSEPRAKRAASVNSHYSNIISLNSFRTFFTRRRSSPSSPTQPSTPAKLASPTPTAVSSSPGPSTSGRHGTWKFSSLSPETTTPSTPQFMWRMRRVPWPFLTTGPREERA